MKKQGFFEWLKKEIRSRKNLFLFASAIMHPYKVIYGNIYAAIISLKVDQLKFSKKFTFTSRIIPIRIIKSQGAKLIVNGKITIESFQGGGEAINISLGENSTLQIDGDFVIGQGVNIDVCENACLKIGGRDKSSGSGITANGKIMVKEYVEIGKDALIAWDVFISDSDWHEIEGQKVSEPVIIHDHVWLAHGVSVLKGVSIGKGSIVAARSVVTKSLPESVLAAGIPAKIIKSDVSWKR